MQQRFLQLLALILSLLLVVALTLTVLGRIPALAFWIVAGIVFLLSFVLYKNPK